MFWEIRKSDCLDTQLVLENKVYYVTRGDWFSGHLRSFVLSRAVKKWGADLCSILWCASGVKY